VCHCRARLIEFPAFLMDRNGFANVLVDEATWTGESKRSLVMVFPGCRMLVKSLELVGSLAWPVWWRYLWRLLVRVGLLYLIASVSCEHVINLRLVVPVLTFLRLVHSQVVVCPQADSLLAIIMR